MADFRVEVDDEDARLHLERIAAFLVDLRPFWPKVVPLFVGWMRKQFETEGQFGGRRWAALSPSYAAWKALAYPGRGILVATGDLKGAASRPLRTARARSLTLTINDPKLQYHETGTPRMPARPLLFGDPLPSSAASDLERASEEFVDDLLRRIP